MKSRMIRRLTILVATATVVLAFASPAWAQTFTKGTEVPVDIHTPDVEAADIDNDGHLDAVVGAHAGSIGTQHVRILAGDGAGNFSRMGDFAPPDTNLDGLAMGNMNNDDYPDLVYSGNGDGTSASVRVALGDGTGNFSQQATATVGTNPGTAALADVDGDSDQDVIVGSAWAGSPFQPVSGTVTVIPNNGDGTLGARTLYTVGNTPGGSPSATWTTITTSTWPSPASAPMSPCSRTTARAASAWAPLQPATRAPPTSSSPTSTTTGTLTSPP